MGWTTHHGLVLDDMLQVADAQTLHDLNFQTHTRPEQAACHIHAGAPAATSFTLGSCSPNLGIECSAASIFGGEKKCPSHIEHVQCLEGKCVCDQKKKWKDGKVKPCGVGGTCVERKCETQAIEAAAIQSVGGANSVNAQSAALEAGQDREDLDIKRSVADGSLGLGVPKGSLPDEFVPAILHPGRGEKANLDRRVVVSLPNGGVSGNTPVLVEGGDAANPGMKKAFVGLINKLESISRKLREAGNAPTDQLPRAPPGAAPQGAAPAGAESAGAEPEGWKWVMPEASLWAASFGPAQPKFRLAAGQATKRAAARWSSFFPYATLAAGDTTAAQQK